MENKEVKTDKYGLILPIAPGISYTIGWWQVEKDGLSYWVNHLREKKWFTQDMENAITEICKERSRSSYYL